jgi:glycogen debranching enzyme
MISGALVLSVATAFTQEVRTIVPWFDLGISPIELSGDARPGVYLASPGRRSIVMGTEDGRFEAWSWPIKWFHDMQLHFRVPKHVAPIPGRDVARRVTVRPEGVTIEYSYETFTVKQHVFAVLDKPAVIMLLEVDAIRPLEIIASFVPDVHYAWPAGLGGQYVAWNGDAKAFLFSESKRQINAFFGSPAITRAADVPAHMLSASPPQFTIAVGNPGQQYTEPRLGEPPGGNVNIRQAYIPIVLAGGEMSRDSARALYDSLLTRSAPQVEWMRRVAHADSIRLNATRITTPDSRFNAAVEWAKVNLDDAMVCNPSLGCGIVAGYGLSGAASDRPGFGWFFGGDAAINALAMTSFGQHELAREGVFRFFARYQRADGKITHEISQSADKVDWFNAYPYPYYHGDTTPFWMLAFGEYFKQSADTTLLRTLWPNLRKAYEWSRSTDSDGDGLMENPLAGAGALEVGDLQIGIVSDVYLSGIWIAALDRFADMADALGEAKTATAARDVRARARKTLEERLWLSVPRQYAFALLAGGKINQSMTAWPAAAMSFDTFDRARGADMAERLASSDVMTDWGARPLSATSSLFDPLHYNNGAVWPFVTGWVALAQYRYHNAHAGRFALNGIVGTGFDESLGRNNEVISGRLYKPLDTSVPHQFFATSMVLTPLMRGLLGVEVDAPRHAITVAPHLPAEWDSVSVENVAVGAERVSFVLTRSDHSIDLRMKRDTRGTRSIVVTFAPALPLGATTVTAASGARVQINGEAGAVIASVQDELRSDAQMRLSWNGGWEVSPPEHRPLVGDRSRALRVLSERMVDGRYVVTLQGRSLASYTLRVRAPGELTAVTVEPNEATMAPLRLTRPDANGWSNLRVTMPGGEGDADNFVTIRLVMES